MASRITNGRAAVMLMGVAVAVVLLAYGGWRGAGAARPDLAIRGERQRRAGRCAGVPAARERDSVDLSDAQLAR